MVTPMLPLSVSRRMRCADLPYRPYKMADALI